MVEDNRETRETVVVDKDRSSNPMGWIVGLIVVIVLLVIFFMSGGFGLFGGGTTTTQGGDAINIDTPDAVNVQPSGGQ